ncbi:MAG: 3-ketoacyl-CoA thiolase [Actinobacteria bacterium]|nr:3-ketoacyl-CoA thiolase [Actinomycetota bacterium]
MPANRPQPYQMPEAEFYWSSGADGRLRIQHCDDCDQLVHPPKPVCHYCRSTNRSVVGVSGAGTVVGFTVNHQQWLPSFPPPYVLASVALAEDARVMITTNIVGCDPDDVVVGLPVAVEFEEDRGTWFPLFRPTGDAPAADLPPLPVDPVATLRSARPMVSTEKFEDKVAITGIGMSRLGRRLMVDPLELTVEAARRAVEDAGLTFDDIDGLSTYPAGSAPGGHSEGGIVALESALRLRPTWFNGGGDLPGQSGVLVAAMMAVATGLCRHVLCFRTVWEATATERMRQGIDAPHGMGAGGAHKVAAPMDFSLPYGAGSAAMTLGVRASHHFARYGTTRDALGAIATTQRYHASLNPDAIYRDPMSMDDYYAARMITTPFGLYDCDIPCDGSIAVIVSAADTARDLRQMPVRVESIGTQILEPVEWDQGTITHEPQVLGPCAHLWSRSSLTTADVDVALLYDGFSFNCLSWLEGLGFCEIGEGGDFVAGGDRIRLGGALPINTHGGQLSHGRTHGFGFFHEAVTQLRGHGGARQVEGAEVAVVTNGGLTPGGAMLLTVDR